MLSIMNAETGKTVHEAIFDDLGEIFNPAWSPDGRYVVFSAISGAWSDLYVYDYALDQRRRLTRDPYGDLQPAWSPDNSKIVFASSRDGNTEIYVMDADGRDVRRLTDHPSNDGEPAWSPDGGKIAFVSHRDENAEIYIMGADGRNIHRLTYNDRTFDRGPVWFDPAYSVLSAGKRMIMWGWLKQTTAERR